MTKLLNQLIFSFTILSLFTNSFISVAEAKAFSRGEIEAVVNKYNSHNVGADYLSKIYKKESVEKAQEFDKFQEMHPEIKQFKSPKLSVEGEVIYTVINQEKVKFNFDHDGFVEVSYKDRSVKISNDQSMAQKFELVSKIFEETHKTSFFSFLVEDAAAGMGKTLFAAFSAFCIILGVGQMFDSTSFKGMVILAKNVCSFTSGEHTLGIDIEKARVDIPRFLKQNCNNDKAKAINKAICPDLQKAQECLDTYVTPKENNKNRGEVIEKRSIGHRKKEIQYKQDNTKII